MADVDEPDELLEEIREVRRRMLGEFGNDLTRYGEYLTELQDSPELRDRLYDPTRGGRKKPAA